MARTKAQDKDKTIAALEARIKSLEHEVDELRNPVVRFEVGRDGRVIEANETLGKIVGRPASKLRGRRLNRVLSDYQKKPDVVFDHVVNGTPYPGSAKTFLTMEVGNTGRFFEFTVRPKRDRRGAVRGLAFRGRDVTIKLQRERRRHYRHTGEALHRVIDQMGLGVVNAYNSKGSRFTASTRLGGVSNGIAAALGFEMGPERPNYTYYRYKPALWRTRVTRLFPEGTIRRLNAALTAGAYSHVDGEILKNDGSPRPARLSILPNKGLWGNTVFTLLIEDRSEHAAMMQRLSRRLVDSEQKTRDLFDNAAYAVFVEDDHGNILDCNRRACELYGYSREEMLDRNARDFLAEFTPQIERDFRRRLQRDGRVSVEWRNRTRDGRLIDVEVDVSLVELHGRRLLHVFCNDITERKRLEQGIRESEQRYRSLFENASDAILLTTPEFVITDANRRACETYGYSRSELVGADVRILASERTEQMLPALLKQIEATGHAVAEAPGRRRDGTIVHTEVSANLVDVGGQDRILVICRDLTERRRAEEALRESEQRYRSLFETVPVGLLRTAPDGRGLDVNPALVRMLGYPDRESLLTIKTADAYVEPKARTQWRRIIERDGFLRDYELQIRRFDGTPIWVLYNARAVKDAEGKTLYYEGALQDITERRAMEKALRTSEARYRAIVEDQTEFICRFERNGTMRFVNAACTRYVGKTPEELIGKSFFPFLPEGDRQQVQAAFSAMTPQNPVVATEHRIQTASGDTRWHQWTNRGIFDDKGLLVEVQGVGRDITERKLAEEALRESEEKYRTLVEQSLQGIVVAQGAPPRLVFANPALADILAYTIDELLALPGRKVRTLIHPDDRTGFFERYRSRVRGEAAPSRYEIRAVRKDGGVRWLEMSANRITYEGRPAVQATFVDITERKQIEQRIQESEQKYRALVEASPDAVFMHDRQGRYLYINAAGARSYGLEPDDVVGRRLDELHAKAAADGMLDSVERVFREEKAVERDTTLVTDVGRFHFSTVLAPIRDETGAVVSVIGIARNVTEQRVLQEQLQRAARLASVGTLAAGVAHEINNPLAVISVDLPRLKRQYKDDPFVSKLCTKLLRMTTRISEITGGLLTFSKASAGAFGKHNLHGPLNGALELMRSRFDYEHKHLVRRYAGKLPAVWCDSDQLQQVFVNLCINALEAMPEQGTLVVSAKVSRRDKTVTLAFADTGKGITPEAAKRAFDPFYTTKDTGTGLGLAISHSIIEDHGGQISIEGKPGKGARVRVVLPVHRAQPGEDGHPTQVGQAAMDWRKTGRSGTDSHGASR